MGSSKPRDINEIYTKTYSYPDLSRQSMTLTIEFSIKTSVGFLVHKSSNPIYQDNCGSTRLSTLICATANTPLDVTYETRGGAK